LSIGDQGVRSKPTAIERCIWLGCVQGKAQGTVWLHVPSLPGCVRPSIIPNGEGIARLGEGRVWVGLVPSIGIPYYTGRCTRYDAIRGAHWIRVPIFTDGGDGEVGGCDEDRGEIPSEGDEIAGSDFEEGSGGLRRLSDSDSTCSCSLRDA
jgi:hypothetical protein